MASPVARSRLLKALVVLALLGGVGALLGRLAWGHYHHRAAGRAMGRRDFAEARRRLAKCLRVWPSDGATLLQAACADSRDGDAAEARRLLDAAADAKAVPEAVAFERELARLQAGDLAGADRYLAACDAHREKPETTLILEALTDGALRAMQLDFARRCLEVWDAARPEPPDRTQAKIWRGELAYRKGETDLALVHLREAAAEAPGHVVARLRLAEALIRYSPAEARRLLEEQGGQTPQRPRRGGPAGRLPAGHGRT